MHRKKLFVVLDGLDYGRADMALTRQCAKQIRQGLATITTCSLLYDEGISQDVNLVSFVGNGSTVDLGF